MSLERADGSRLAEDGLRISWAAADHRDASRFVVSFMTTDDKFQVFLRVPRDGKSPEAVATDVLTILKKRPAKWSATFHSIQPKITTRPTMAGWRWKRERIGLG